MFNSTKSYYNQLNKWEQLAKAKDILVVADSRDLADEIKQNIIDNSELFGHNDTGKMENSIAVRSAGNGDYNVVGIDYTKYVNGYDRETGTGFVDDAVSTALLDIGGNADLII